MRLFIGVMLLALLPPLAACGSARPTTAPTAAVPEFAPFTRTPPPELGTGLVCGAAADRVLGITDHVDLTRFAGGSGAPRSPLIREAIARYGSSSAKTERDRAAGLIVGQCAAYGFYIITYRECLQPRIADHKVGAAVVRGCIERRRWTVYTQQ